MYPDLLQHVDVFKFRSEKIEVDSEGNPVSEIQLLRVGNWDHPKYGKILITPATFTRLEQNFREDVRQVELAIDPEHKSTEGAYGWIKNLKNKGMNGLYALVEWTKLGTQAIKDKIYKYISAEYSPNYQDPETGKTHKDVMLGAALTNRPFIKGMAPVSLSEDFAGVKPVLVFTKEATELYKSGKINSDRRSPKVSNLDEFGTQLQDLMNTAVELEEFDDEEKQHILNDLGLIAQGFEEPGEETEHVPQYYSEPEEVGLSEDDVRGIIREEIQPLIDALNQKVSLNEGQTQKLTNTLKFAELDQELDSYSFNEQTGRGKLTPAQIPIVKDLLTSTDPETANKIRQLIDSIPAWSLSEIGHAFGETGIMEKVAPGDMAKEAEKIALSEGITKEEAMRKVLIMTGDIS